jgi:hypothetical protein
MALVWYLTGVIAIITLVPLEFRWPSHLRLVGFTTVADVVQNIALFLPLGFFIGFAHRGRAALTGLALSVVVESVQQFIPGRSPSLIDIATNTLGAWIGGALHQWFERLLDRRSKSAGIRALDLPLMGLGYLMVPLLWLSGLGAQTDSARRWLVALPALTIAIVFASVSRHHLEPRGFVRARTALLGGAAVLVGLVPGWYNDPSFLVGGAGMVVVLILAFSDLLARLEPVGRRFEVPTVLRAMVPFTVYLGLTAVWPLGGFGGSWVGGAGFSRPVQQLGHLGILRLLELIAAASVVGYAVAEVAGRSSVERGRHRLILAVGSVLGVGLVALRGFHPGQGASAIEAALLGGATWVGAELYWRQRAFVRARLGRFEPTVGPLPRPSYGRIEAVPAAEGAP